VSLRRVVLLRHGQTDYNVAGRMQGHLDSHLTEEGREQARRAAPVIARMSLDRMISSDLTRAVDTAEEVSTASGLAV
jgi:2,3-bisphosphoglycerate-dependent phosphoglycerate mutase/probable phosphoglycerate mutase